MPRTDTDLEYHRRTVKGRVEIHIPQPGGPTLWLTEVDLRNMLQYLQKGKSSRLGLGLEGKRVQLPSPTN